MTRATCPRCEGEYAVTKFGTLRKHGCIEGAPDVVALPWSAPPLTQNQVRRMHFQVEAKRKLLAKNEARWAIRAARIQPRFAANVILHWRMPDRIRRDGDGAAPTLKVVLDALVAEGILPDDSWMHVAHSGVTCHPPQRGMPGSLWIALSEPEPAEEAS